MQRTRFAPTVTIAGRPVGDGAPCYVIAEAGANHNRDLDTAHRLIDVAADAGADAVKFQVYSGRALYSTKTPAFRYLRDVGEQRPVAELLSELALPREWIGDLVAHARERSIPWFATPFDARAVDELAAAGVPALKIASFEIVDLELIGAAAATGLPLVISCGMATLGEIEEALDAVASAGGREVALLHCASLYPSPPEIMNLRAMETMRTAFGVPVGLSDHTTGTAVAIGARGLGMALLEKHYTLDRTMAGPDHPFAVQPDELGALVAGVRAVERALGDGRLQGPSELEAEEMYRLGRRSVIAARDISAGTVIVREDLVVKRPGFGIKPRDIDHVVGRRAAVDIEADDVITWDMV